MIAESPAGLEQSDWQRQLREAVRDPARLLARLGLPLTGLSAARAAAAGFPLRVPEAFIARMRPGDPQDPLLRQVLPLGRELEPVAGFGPDPVGDLAAAGEAGWLHKYEGRSLLVATGACAVHCRYCFRRHFPYQSHQSGPSGLDATVAALVARPTVSEVILSGGDPLVLDDRRLAALAGRLTALPQVRRLRIHSRLPVVIPDRICEALLGWLEATPARVVMVIHANHANEIDAAVAAALARLRAIGVDVLNQAVLLAGVNDDADTLAALSERLHEAGALPYYLHLLDPVAGAAHFDVPLARALALHRALTDRLPGYLVPRLVREDPGAPAKTALRA